VSTEAIPEPLDVVAAIDAADEHDRKRHRYETKEDGDVVI
jgi:hypothetical protein